MLPDWWRGGFPDVEKLLKTLYTPHLSNVQFVPYLPKPDTYEATLQAGGAFVRFARIGGRINFDQVRDEPRVQAAVISRSRETSWELVEFIRQTLWDGFKKGAVVPTTTVMLQMSEEVLGPQLIPENIVEPRLVPITVGLHTWRTAGTHYRQALGL
jgi:hypothetical protein